MAAFADQFSPVPIKERPRRLTDVNGMRHSSQAIGASLLLISKCPIQTQKTKHNSGSGLYIARKMRKRLYKQDLATPMYAARQSQVSALALIGGAMARSWNSKCLSLLLHSFVSSRFASDSSKRDLPRGRDGPVFFFTLLLLATFNVFVLSGLGFAVANLRTCIAAFLTQRRRLG
jgi:hypothetical protein